MVGETPNLAARLQALAEPGAVVDRRGARAGSWAACSSYARPRPGAPEGLRRAGAGLRASLGERRRREPLRGPARRRPHRRWSGASRSWRCCSTAGSRPRTARARSCCSRASRASASRGWSGRCASGSRASRTPPALPVLLALPRRQRALPGHRAARARGRARARRPAARPSSTSSRRCWRRGVDDVARGRAAARRPARRSRPATATRRSTSARSSGRSGPSQALLDQLAGLARRGAGAGALRGRRTGSTRPRSSCSDRVVERVAAPAGAGAGHLPARVRGRPGPGTAARRPRSRSAGSAAAQGAAMVERVAGGKALPAEVLERDRWPGPTACRCSSRS